MNPVLSLSDTGKQNFNFLYKYFANARSFLLIYFRK